MARKSDRTSGAIGQFLKRLFHRDSEADEDKSTLAATPQPRTSRTSTPPTTRPTRRESDIPLSTIDQAYTPPVTSSKASFRSDGSDHQSDQELAFIADDRWKDEDRFTNKSGDPRIGTHGRNQEQPNESRGETRE